LPYEFKLPDVGEGTEEGELVRWLVEVGQEVDADEPVAEIQTDKVQTELYSPVSGTVMELRFAEGDMVPVGSVFVTFEVNGEAEGRDTAGEAVAAEAADAPSVAETPDPPRQNGRKAEDGEVRRKKTRATPAVRRVARELGVDLALVEGSGIGGRVMEGDVRAFGGTDDQGVAVGASVETVEGEDRAEPVDAWIPEADRMREDAAAENGSSIGSERVPLRGIRRAMFVNMARSSATVAGSFGLEEVDLTRLVALRQQMRDAAEQKGARITYLPFAIKAAVTALKEFPYLNASVEEDKQRIVLHHRYDVGVAVDTPQGLLVPVLRDAGGKSIIGLAREIRDLAERGREGKLGAEDFEGATFTVTNVGSIGGIAAMPVVDHPQVAILGLHRIQRKPVVRGEDEIVAADVMNVSLGFDHRVIDGATCFNFLARVSGLLEKPNLLFMEMV